MKVEKTLGELGVKPTEGQHLLRSDAVVEALVEAGEVEGKNVVEIGGGTGAITEKLSGKAGNLTVVERDTRLSEYLSERFPGVEVLNQDFLDHDLSEYERCVSNIPFQISSEVLEKLGEAQLQSSLIVQKELAEKAVAEPGSGSYSEFSIRMNYYFIPVKLQEVSRSSFYPVPEVDASILKLYPNRERHGIENEELFLRLVRALFTQKRKKVRNAFVDSRHILEMEKEEAKKLRDDLPHSEERVNTLDVYRIGELAEFLGSEI